MLSFNFRERVMTTANKVLDKIIKGIEEKYPNDDIRDMVVFNTFFKGLLEESCSKTEVINKRIRYIVLTKHPTIKIWPTDKKEKVNYVMYGKGKE